MRIPLNLVLFSALALLFGCFSMTEEEQSQNLISNPPMQMSVADSLETPYFTEGTWPEENWWDVFASCQLNKLIDTALAQNPTLQSVQQRVELAKQQAIITEGKLFPLVYFNGSDNWQYLSKNGLYKTLNPSIPLNASLIDLTLAFTYEFDFWSKYLNQYRASVSREKAEEAQAAQAKLIITTAIAQGYFALVTNLIKADLIRELYEVRKGVFDLQNLLLSNALYSAIPVYLAEEELFESKKLVEAIEQEIATDKHLINALAGRGPDEPIEVDLTLATLPKQLVIPETLSLELLSRRPDLMAQIWTVEAWAHEVGAAKANYFPNINIAAFLGFETLKYSTILSTNSMTGGADPAFSLPIYTAGVIQANIDAKMASFLSALYEYNDLILKSAQEVTDLLVLAKSIYAQQREQTTIVKSATARYNLIELRQLNGLDNELQVYALQVEVLQKKIANLDLIYGQYRAAIKLIKALGGGYCSDFLPISKGAE